MEFFPSSSERFGRKGKWKNFHLFSPPRFGVGREKKKVRLFFSSLGSIILRLSPPSLPPLFSVLGIEEEKGEEEFKITNCLSFPHKGSKEMRFHTNKAKNVQLVQIQLPLFLQKKTLILEKFLKIHFKKLLRATYLEQ